MIHAIRDEDVIILGFFTFIWMNVIMSFLWIECIRTGTIVSKLYWILWDCGH